MTETTEAEETAAERAYVAVWGNCGSVDAGNVDQIRRTAIRAALTAAAQVREGATQAELAQLRAGLSEAVQIALGSDGDFTWDAEQRLRELKALASAPALLPI